MLSRRGFLRVGGAVLGGAAAAGLYTWQVEPFWVEVVRRRMALPGLPPELAGRTLMQVSDLHVGPRVDPRFLMRALRDAAALEPDFVALTGDFVTYRTATQYRELARVLAVMPRGKLGTVASLGNHDYGVAWRQLPVADGVTRVMRDAGATVLRNEHALIGGIQFGGLADYWSPEFGNPLPIPQLLSALPRAAGSGAFDVGAGRTLYVNRGLGYMIQVRFNVRPEITLFTLERA